MRGCTGCRRTPSAQRTAAAGAARLLLHQTCCCCCCRNGAATWDTSRGGLAPCHDMRDTRSNRAESECALTCLCRGRLVVQGRRRLLKQLETKAEAVSK